MSTVSPRGQVVERVGVAPTGYLSTTDLQSVPALLRDYLSSLFKDGACGENRTHDLLLTRQVLCRLSYTGIGQSPSPPQVAARGFAHCDEPRGCLDHKGAKVRAWALPSPFRVLHGRGDTGTDNTVLALCVWRKRKDLNLRYPLRYGGFQDHCLKPLGHSSVTPTVYYTLVTRCHHGGICSLNWAMRSCCALTPV